MSFTVQEARAAFGLLKFLPYRLHVGTVTQFPKHDACKTAMADETPAT